MMIRIICLHYKSRRTVTNETHKLDMWGRYGATRLWVLWRFARTRRKYGGKEIERGRVLMHCSYVGVHGMNVKQLLPDYRLTNEHLERLYITLERIQSLINISRNWKKERKNEREGDTNAPLIHGMATLLWKCKKRSVLKGTPDSLSGITNRRILLTTGCPNQEFSVQWMCLSLSLSREYESWYARKKVSRWQPLWRKIYDSEVVAQVESWTPRDKLSFTLAKMFSITASHPTPLDSGLTWNEEEDGQHIRQNATSIYSPDTNKSNLLVECDEVGSDDTRPY